MTVKKIHDHHYKYYGRRKENIDKNENFDDLLNYKVENKVWINVVGTHDFIVI